MSTIMLLLALLTLMHSSTAFYLRNLDIDIDSAHYLESTGLTALHNNRKSRQLWSRPRYNFNPARFQAQNPWDNDFYTFDASRSRQQQPWGPPPQTFFTTNRPEPSPRPQFSQITTPRSPCEKACQTTPQYNPVCGTDSQTYPSQARLLCASKCGKNVSLKHMGTCVPRPT